MIKLNRMTEYSLIALKHMSKKAAGQVTSAREVSDIYGLPFEITAKTLQKLKDSQIIQSAQGSKGGYVIQMQLSQVSLGAFLNHMEGDQGVVACCTPKADVMKACECEYHARCEIKGMMNKLNQKIITFLSSITLGDLTDAPASFGVLLPQFSQTITTKALS